MKGVINKITKREDKIFINSLFLFIYSFIKQLIVNTNKNYLYNGQKHIIVNLKNY